jgi:hypothetical protein
VRASSKQSRSAQGHKLIVALLFLALALALGSVSAPASAQAECPPGQVLDEATQLCVDPETGLPVDPVDEEEPVDGEEPVEEEPVDGEEPAEEEPVEEEPVEEEPSGDLASFTLYHLACDNDFEADAVRDGGGVGPADGCVTFGKPPFIYTISANGSAITTVTLEATERNFARFDLPSPVPAGTLTISIAPVDGYVTELVSCALQIQGDFGEIVEPSMSGGSATISTEPDQNVECWVYNVNRQAGEQEAGDDLDDAQGIIAEPPAATGMRVNFTVRNCEAGTTATDDLSSRCLTPAVGVTFTVSSETTALTTGTTDVDGNVEFANMPDGIWAFIETLPAGFGEPVVVCMGTNQPEDYMEVLFGNQIRVSTTMFSDQAEAYLDCTWFNLPATGSDNGPQIFIQARRCVVDLNMPDNATLAEAETLCPEVFAGKSFTVDVNGEEIDSDTSRDNGQVFFTKLPAPNGGGIYGIAVSLGNREQTLAVFCDNNFGADVFHTLTTTITNGNRIDQEMYEGQTLRCSWFIAAYPPVNPNITPVPGPDANFPWIQVYVRECPPTVDMSAPNGDLCQQDVTGAAFDFSINGEPFETIVNRGNDGRLDFDPGGMTGTWTIAPRPVEGYGDPRFSCEVARADGSIEASTGTLTASSPGIQIEFDGTGGVLCAIFYQAGSGEQATGDAATDDGNVEEVADANDADGDEADGVVEDDVTDEEQADDTGAEEDEPVEEEAAAAANTLTIQFWSCPDDVDPAADQVDLLLACAMDQEERAVTLQVDGDSQPQTVTGSAMWEFVDPTITVSQPGGTTGSSAWCSSTWEDNGEGAGEFPDTVNLADGALTITVGHPATTVYCDWFLFGAPAASGEPQHATAVLSANTAVWPEGRRQ